MPDTIDGNGLQVKSLAELDSDLTAALQAIYGADIDLSSSSPDGQAKGIFAQAGADLRDLLVQVYNLFDPDNAIGVVLDQRAAINGIQRQAATFTITNVTIVTSRAVTLYGLDQSAQPVYTVSDNAGNAFQLQTTQAIGSAGTYVFSFQAAVPGAVLTIPNTITSPVTIVLGVSSVNNPSAATSIGLNEESDAVFKVRRQKSVALASQGFLAGLFAALENVNGVTSVFVYENRSASTDGDGIPGHSIWVIVAGTGAALDIANAIYTKRNAGCGMKGDQSFTITQADGSPFLVYWDVVATESLFIAFTASSIDGVNTPNVNGIRLGLPVNFVPGVHEEVDINHLATKVQAIDPNCLVTVAGFSLTHNGSYTNTLTPSAKNKQFVVTTANIIILPILISPPSSTVVHGNTQTFVAYGGYGAYTWSFQTNNSGGTINSATGFYTAGATPSTDTIKVTDAHGNTQTATVLVT